MAKTPRASKASDATASGKTKSPTKAAPAKAPAPKKAAKKTAATAKAPAPKKAAKKTAAPAKASAPKKAAKQTAAATAPASKKVAKKKAAAAEAPAPKKVAKKKAAAAEAPAPKKATKKKAAAAEAPAPKKATKKKAAKKAETAPQSEQLALSMDIDPPAAPAAAKPLQPGDRVPDFSLASDDGQTYSRQSLAGTRFVLYFYPKDDTPGCTRQACDFRDHRPQLEAASVKVLGVSGDSLASHGKFRSKYGLDFPLLSDPDRAVAQAFGVVGIKKLYGKTNIGVIRSTFVVGPDGVVEKTFSPVKVDGHADAVLQALG